MKTESKLSDLPTPFRKKTSKELKEAENYGCGINCLSYITHVKERDIRKLTSSDYVDHREVVRILRHLGYRVRQLTIPTIYPGRKYIITVPSLNNMGQFHFIVAWCRESVNGFALPVQVYDPVVSGKKYINQNKLPKNTNEIRLTSWTSIIEILGKTEQ